MVAPMGMSKSVHKPRPVPFWAAGLNDLHPVFSHGGHVAFTDNNMAQIPGITSGKLSLTVFRAIAIWKVDRHRLRAVVPHRPQ